MTPPRPRSQAEALGDRIIAHLDRYPFWRENREGRRALRVLLTVELFRAGVEIPQMKGTVDRILDLDPGPPEGPDDLTTRQRNIYEFIIRTIEVAPRAANRPARKEVAGP